MKTVSIVELRRDFPKILAWLQTRSGPIRLTYRGTPIADITPLRPKSRRPPKDDPFYRISDLAVRAPPLTNKKIDRTIYGE